ncbi:MAG: alpha/beta hydrolase [Thermomicrobiales bacterium]
MSIERNRSLTRRALLTAMGASTILAACSGASAMIAARDDDTSPTSPTALTASTSAGQPTVTLDTPTTMPSIMSAATSATPQDVPTATQVATPVIPSGSQVLNRTFTSAALGRAMPYFIYLPVGYTESGIRYPVLYMLHGHGGSNTEWIGYGLLETADTIINVGQIPPMLIVLPQGDQAFWVNHADDDQRWGDYTAQDVVHYIDANYRTIPDAGHRAIGGLSMGADGAMQLAMNYPGTFGSVGVHSPTLRDYQSTSAYVSFFGNENYFNAHDPVHLVQQYPDRARDFKLWLDVGANDTDWHDSTVSYHTLLAQLNVSHTWHDDWPGIHDGYYWGGHAADYVHFYGAALADT